MITARDLHALAIFMVDTHGTKAVHLADRAVDEMMAINEEESANCWIALRSVVVDMLAGRLNEQEVRLH